METCVVALSQYWPFHLRLLGKKALFEIFDSLFVHFIVQESQEPTKAGADPVGAAGGECPTSFGKISL